MTALVRTVAFSGIDVLPVEVQVAVAPVPDAEVSA